MYCFCVCVCVFLCGVPHSPDDRELPARLVPPQSVNNLMTFLGYLAKMGTLAQRKVVFEALPRAFGVGLKVGMTLHHLALFLTCYTMVRREGQGKGHGRLFRETFRTIFDSNFTEYFMMKWQNDRRQIGGGLMSWSLQDVLSTTHYKVPPDLAPLTRAVVFEDEDAGLSADHRATLDRARLLKDPEVPVATKIKAIRSAPPRSLAFEMLNPEAYDKNSPEAADVMAAMIKGSHVPGLRMVRMLKRYCDAGLFVRHPDTECIVRRAVRGAAAIVTPMHYLYAIMALLNTTTLKLLKPEYGTALAMLDAGFFRCFEPAGEDNGGAAAEDNGGAAGAAGGGGDNGCVCRALASLRDTVFLLDVSGSMQCVYQSSPLRSMDICFLIGYIAHRAGGECWAYDNKTYPCDFSALSGEEDHQSVVTILQRARNTVGGLTVPQQAIEAVTASIAGRRTVKMFVWMTDNDVNCGSRGGESVNTIMDRARCELFETCGHVGTLVLATVALPGHLTMFDPENHLNGVMTSDEATSADVIDTIALRTKTLNFTDC